MEPVEQALATFRKPYNCAQTICNAFGRADLLESMSGCARGNAPGGLCGSLYAATQLCPAQAVAITAAFEARNGATTCAKLKGECRVPCPECVRTSAELLQAALRA